MKKIFLIGVWIGVWYLEYKKYKIVKKQQLIIEAKQELIKTWHNYIETLEKILKISWILSKAGHFRGDILKKCASLKWENKIKIKNNKINVNHVNHVNHVNRFKKVNNLKKIVDLLK